MSPSCSDSASNPYPWHNGDCVCGLCCMVRDLRSEVRILNGKVALASSPPCDCRKRDERAAALAAAAIERFLSWVHTEPGRAASKTAQAATESPQVVSLPKTIDFYSLAMKSKRIDQLRHARNEIWGDAHADAQAVRLRLFEVVSALTLWDSLSVADFNRLTWWVPDEVLKVESD